METRRPPTVTPKPRRLCTGCKREAPPTPTMGTLALAGWRMRVEPLPNGAIAMQVYCPACSEAVVGAPPLQNRGTGGAR